MSRLSKNERWTPCPAERLSDDGSPLGREDAEMLDAFASRRLCSPSDLDDQPHVQRGRWTIAAGSGQCARMRGDAEDRWTTREAGLQSRRRVADERCVPRRCRERIHDVKNRSAQLPIDNNGTAIQNKVATNVAKSRGDGGIFQSASFSGRSRPGTTSRARSMTPEQYVAKWKGSQLGERQASQEQFQTVTLLERKGDRPRRPFLLLTMSRNIQYI